MKDEYGETCLSFKKLQISKKCVCHNEAVETHGLFCLKKKFWVRWSVKKVMLTVFNDIKSSNIIDFFEKAAIVNSFLLPTP